MNDDSAFSTPSAQDTNEASPLATDTSVTSRHPVGSLTGRDGRFVAIVRHDGEVRVPLDIDGVRYWLMTPPGGDPAVELAAVKRRIETVRAAGKQRPKVSRADASPLPLEALDGLVEWMRGLVRSEIGKPDPNEWLDQHESPLGKRRHLALVRAEVLKGRKEGRRVLVRRAEVDAYIESCASRRDAAVKAQKGDKIEDELRGLGFEVSR